MSSGSGKLVLSLPLPAGEDGDTSPLPQAGRVPRLPAQHHAGAEGPERPARAAAAGRPGRRQEEERRGRLLVAASAAGCGLTRACIGGGSSMLCPRERPGELARFYTVSEPRRHPRGHTVYKVTARVSAARPAGAPAATVLPRSPPDVQPPDVCVSRRGGWREEEEEGSPRQEALGAVSRTYFRLQCWPPLQGSSYTLILGAGSATEMGLPTTMP